MPLFNPPGVPAAHATTHQNAGSDEISVAGLSGLLADNQNPTAHATNHLSGGSDAIKLDDLAAPDDNVDLNASSLKHGLLKKLSGLNTDVFHGDGVYGPIALATDVSGDLAFANLAQGSALSVLGVTGNAVADNASIAAGTDHQVLRRSGANVAFGAVNLAQAAAVTGTLPIGNLPTSIGLTEWMFVGGDAGGYNPADTTPFYLSLNIGPLTGDPSTTAATVANATIPNARVACRIIAAYIDVYVISTLGSAETGTAAIRVNNTTDTTISSSVQWTAVAQSYNNTGLNIALAVGDYFQIKIIPPAWATNPISTFYICRVIAAFP